MFKPALDQKRMGEISQKNYIFKSEKEAIQTLDYYLILFEAKLRRGGNQDNDFIFEGMLRTSILEEKRMLIEEEHENSDSDANRARIGRKSFTNFMIKSYLSAIAT